MKGRTTFPSVSSHQKDLTTSIFVHPSHIQIEHNHVFVYKLGFRGICQFSDISVLLIIPVMMIIIIGLYRLGIGFFLSLR